MSAVVSGAAPGPDAIAPNALRPLPYAALTPQQRVERYVDDFARRPERSMANTLAAAHGRHQSRRFSGFAVTGFGEL